MIAGLLVLQELILLGGVFLFVLGWGFSLFCGFLFFFVVVSTVILACVCYV